jgi:crotonobetainyl-CoA:carnitine CoA-transferase CaiB-like acyl-CoA transferase
MRNVTAMWQPAVLRKTRPPSIGKTFSADLPRGDRFGIIFGQPDQEFQLTESSQKAGSGRGAVQRELEKLTDAGIVARWYATIHAVLARKSQSEVAAQLPEADAAFGVMNDIAGLISHPKLRTITLQTPAGEVPCVAPPAVLTGKAPCFRATFSLGKHELNRVASPLKTKTTRRPPRPRAKPR